MDDAPFALSPDLFVLRQAGIRQLLPAFNAHCGSSSPASKSWLASEPWATFLTKIPAAPSMVWTYRELGEDLAGRGNPARGALWREIIRDLHLPRGYVAFWPYSLLEGNEYLLKCDAFVEGLSRIGPKALVVFDAGPVEGFASAMLGHVRDALPWLRILTVQVPSSVTGDDTQLAGEIAGSVRLFLQTITG